LTMRCSGNKRDGSPCTATVEPPKQYCWWHDPANADKRRRAASKGGRGRPQAELANIKERLSDLSDDVLEGRQDKSVAAVASQILNVYLRAVSVELKAREQLELIERLEALEEALEQKGTRYGA
jgi:hypothetical protein